ncbi:hypothetical protein TRFO_35789 [Tritrichomonas foetus]|uniref:Initiator binding domain-containing protein n=1 Tax=Tritrichomonas foetus TaxID=1144522 RepID=A0A1J4JGV1_9EUKA|nr:hypothetical protein TRFO_35789 [Tritrichomonas foetus]|eukprot:OHS97913.1 hypothetical protein TRFO_35789 [Tritrichomonas foetus]
MKSFFSVKYLLKKNCNMDFQHPQYALCTLVATPQPTLPPSDLTPRPRRVLLSTPDSSIMPPLLEPMPKAPIACHTPPSHQDTTNSEDRSFGSNLPVNSTFENQPISENGFYIENPFNSKNPCINNNSIVPSNHVNLNQILPRQINRFESKISNSRLIPHYSIPQAGLSFNYFCQQQNSYEISGREPSLSLVGGRSINTSTPVFLVRKAIQAMEFDKVVADHTITINPKRMDFIPASAWQNENVAFGVLVTTFFRKRNSMHCKFPNKIFNALKLSSFMPEFIPHIGVEWVTETVFRVDRVAFARLLGVRAIEGGLFHQQGNFPSHGFYELPFAESDQLSRTYGFGPADLSQVRFMTHSSGMFKRSSTEMDIEKCKWNGKH